jgi:hypothetical protein
VLQKRQPTGIYLTRRGDIHLMVEHVGSTFRVVVTHVRNEALPEEVIYSGSARNAEDAFILADQAAEQASVRIAA